jgi:hypothetical protein
MWIVRLALRRPDTFVVLSILILILGGLAIVRTPTDIFPNIDEADKAAVEQYSALASFEKIYAPFDGVITARNTDIGDLINSGSGTGVKTDLFHIAQPGKLRVYVNVPEEYSRGIKTGMTAASLSLNFPAASFRETWCAPPKPSV